MHPRGILLSAVCLLAGGVAVSAQTTERNLQFGVQGRYSHLLDGHGIYNELAATHNYGVCGATVGWTGEQDAFARAWNFPSYGLGFTYAGTGSLQFRNNSRLGNIYNLFGWVEFDLLRTRTFRLGPLLEVGVCHSPEAYDYQTNPHNYYIGSKFFTMVGTGVRAEWLVSPSWSLHGGVYLTHHSNGMLRAPNLGINEVSFALGIRRYFTPTEFILRRETQAETPEYRKGLRWNVYAAAGVHSCPVELDAVLKDGGPAGQGAPVPARLRAVAGVEAVWRYAPLFATGLGLEADYAANNYAYADRILSGREDAAGYSPLRLGVYLTQEFWYRQLAFHVALGAYLFKRTGLTEDVGVLFEKVGVRYHFRGAGGLFLGLDLRAHQFDRSYSLEWSLGYPF